MERAIIFKNFPKNGCISRMWNPDILEVYNMHENRTYCISVKLIIEARPERSKRLKFN
jgi:hypothetical protein